MAHRRKRIVWAGVVCATATVAALAGCAGSPSEGGGGAVEAEAPTYQELVEQYPNEYASSMMQKTDEEGEDNSHANLTWQLEVPAVRAGGVAVIREVPADDPEKADIGKTCLSCKTSQFNRMFEEEEGFSVFDGGNVMTEEDFAAMDGQYFDCYSCHSWNDGKLELAPASIFANPEVFPRTAAFFAELNPEEAACGQCHNYACGRDALNGYTQEQAQECDPFRYGTDPEGMYRYLVEIGAYATDEATGILMVQANHPQVEVFQGSIHQSMGLTCIDCHMNEAADEQDSTYVSHDASSPVAEDDGAMELCLTCHKDQDGIASTEDMRAFLKERQDAQAARQREVEGELEGFYALILDAVERGSVDEDALQQAKDGYSFARFLVKEQQMNLNDPVDGAQIAHDPDQMRSMLERASALVEEGSALLA